MASLDELVILNDSRLSDEEITTLKQKAPFLAAMHAQAASNGTYHRYKKTTTASSAAFRDVDEGLIKTKAQRTVVNLALKILDATFDVDVAEAEAYRDGVDAYLGKESGESLMQTLSVAEKQIWYGTGTGGDSSGFAGLANNPAYDKTGDTYVIEPTTPGSTADSQTSVWVVRSDAKNLSYIAGNDGVINFDPDNVEIIKNYADPTTDAKAYPAYYVPMFGWAGLQLGNEQNIVRICNIEGDLDDDDISRAVELMTEDPTHIVMNRKARGLLQRSRTATSPSGAPAARPIEWEGIPIIETQAINSSEAVVAAS
jgi:hypothetical protein